ncbi:MAG: MFS transporter [Proteobacteria bacterium]|nr:MFS transporter [Pseudomonadota bacterium]
MVTTLTSHRLDIVRVALLSVGHMVVDLYPPFLAALLPLLIERLGMSLTLASMLASILMVSAALSQPLFGILSDKIGGRKLVFWGPMMAATGLSFMGLLPSYILLIPFLVIGGLGVACFHPQAAALTGFFSGPKKGLGVSLFMLGGNVGYGLGPLVILTIVLALGLERSYVALIPAAIFVLALVRYFPETMLRSPALEVDRSAIRALRFHDLRRFALLWFVVWLRSTAILSLITFLPTFQTMRGLSLTAGGSSFTVFMIFGALGGFLGGGLSDRIGRKTTVVLSFLLVIPVFYGFLYGPVHWTFLFLAPLGFLFFLGESPCIVMAQETAPGRGGTMSALIMGFAWGMAGLVLMAVGAFADAFGMKEAMDGLLVLPAVALVLALFLPQVTSEYQSSASGESDQDARTVRAKPAGQ